MPLPIPRGPASRLLTEALAGSPRPVPELREACAAAVAGPVPVLHDDDVQLTLYLLYELHYGLDVDPGWEWHTGLLEARAVLEDALEADLRHRFQLPAPDGDLTTALFELTAEAGAAGRGSLPSYLAREAGLDQVAELFVLRSTYQLKEADPHSWAVPRLRGRAKAALAEIQFDEYGAGDPDRVHATIFARGMRELGLDDTPNAYLDRVPAVALTSVNAVSMFGLHRRLRGALCGHLAAFEMTSALPARRVAAGLRRLGLAGSAVDFFDEHVVADSVHEQVAARDLCGGLVEAEPALTGDVLLGVGACLGLDALVADHVLDRWRAGRSALRDGDPARLAAVP